MMEAWRKQRKTHLRGCASAELPVPSSRRDGGQLLGGERAVGDETQRAGGRGQ